MRMKSLFYCPKQSALSWIWRRRRRYRSKIFHPLFPISIEPRAASAWYENRSPFEFQIQFDFPDFGRPSAVASGAGDAKGKYARKMLVLVELAQIFPRAGHAHM
jgi:hypothetical protein